VASAILVELNIRLTVLVVETARLERRGVNDIINAILFFMAVTYAHKNVYRAGLGPSGPSFFLQK
jgi:hypothetical protein